MSKKSGRIAALIQDLCGQDLAPHYLAYFECFNRHLFYEAHDVLEELWLAERHGPEGLFYKGLIQLAGAFVHLQKNRPSPAAALFRLARTSLSTYPTIHQGLDLAMVRTLIEQWLARLESKAALFNGLVLEPRLELRRKTS